MVSLLITIIVPKKTYNNGSSIYFRSIPNLIIKGMKLDYIAYDDQPPNVDLEDANGTSR